MTDDPFQRQLELEHEGVQLGMDQYRTNLRNRDLTDLPPGVRLMKRAIEPTAAALTEYTEHTGSGQGGVYRPFFRKIDPHVAAFLAAKRIVNSLASNNRESYQSVCIGVANMLITHLDYEEFKKEAPGYVYTIEKDNKWASESHRRATLLRAKVKLLGKTEYPQKVRYGIGQKLVEMFIEATGMVERVMRKHPVTGRENYYLCSTPLTDRWLEKANAECELLQPLHFPMVVPPRDWNSPVGGGFLNNNGTLQVPLVKTRNKPELMALADKDLTKVYSALNIIQRTPWRINKKIFHVVEQVWKVGDRAGLPARDLPELPKKTWAPDTVPNKEELIAWKKKVTSIHERHARDRSKRIATDIKLFVSKRMMEEEKVYFVWNLDWRGRMYPIQQFVNPQSDDSGKSLLEFAEGKPLGKDGAFWLAVHGANTFGYDKTSFEERLAWVVEREAKIIAAAEDPMGMLGFWEEADNPFMFLAFCFEWAGYRREGEAYVSHLPVSLDGSCNGLQNFSAMLRDEVGGKACNLVPLPNPSDIYQEVADVLSSKVERDAANGEVLAIPWLKKVTRKITKRGVMTTPYGVTQYGLRAQLKYEVEKIDKNYLGTDLPGPLYYYLSDRLFESIGEVVVAARTAMTWLQAVASIASKAGVKIRWTTPIGFCPVQDYRAQKLLRMQTVYGGIRLQCGIWEDTLKLDRRKMSSGIAPNFVHSLDASHCMSTVNLCRDFGIQNFAMVHDSYGTLAADVGKLAYYLREAFITQYTNDVLQAFRDEIALQLPPELAAELPPIPPKGGLNLGAVRQSRYFFA